MKPYHLSYFFMKNRKIIAVFSFVALVFASVVSADNVATTPDAIIVNLQNLVKRYWETIMSLQAENVKLKDEIAALKTWGASTQTNQTTTASSWTSTVAATTPTAPSTNTWSTTKASSVDKYNKLVDKINSMSQSIFKDNGLSSGSTIWLFEFIEPSNFFISIDDKQNPAWVTAFKRKILYSYDSSLNLDVVGIFDLDYKSQYYITKYWKNPFARTSRIRVKNPLYTGKLLEEATATTTASTSSSSSVSSTSTASTVSSSASVPTNVTLDEIKKAYNNNKILDALKYSNEYIKTDPNNMDVAKIRYRSFYILWKYSDSLQEIQKLEQLSSWNLDKVVACDWKIIAKLVKNNDLYQKYWDICAKK